MRVRAATVDDAGGIAEVHVRTWQAAYRGQLPDAVLDGLSVRRRTAGWQVMLADTDLPLRGAFVAVEGERVVGFAHVCPSRDADAAPGTGEVTSIYVLPEHWRHGVGRALLDAALASLAAAGCSAATLWVLESNLRARAFYESNGWRADGAAKREDRGEMVLVEVRYRRELQPSG